MWDYALSGVINPFGPFESQRAFDDWRVTLYDQFGKRHPPTATYVASIREAMPDDHPIVFTHGDIHRENVIVNVVGDDQTMSRLSLFWTGANLDGVRNIGKDTS